MALKMKYFILKPKSKTRIDPYAEASRWAMREYAQRIRPYDPKLAEELKMWAYEETIASGELGGKKHERTKSRTVQDQGDQETSERG